MKIISEQKKAVVAGVIATLLVLYFVQPILAFLGQILLRVANVAFSAYLDRLYAEIATGDFNYAFMLVIFVYIAGFGVCSVGLTAIVLSNIISKPKKTELGDNQKKKKHKPKEKKREPKESMVFFGCLFCAGALLFAIAAVDDYVRVKTVSTFRQYTTILAPHIGDHQLKELQAKFASMKNKKEYMELMTLIATIAKSKNINLPPNRLYPP